MGGPPDLPALFQAVWDAPDDDAPRHVLADALQLRGDPRGELIALQFRDDASARHRATYLQRTHRVAFLGEGFLHAEVTWDRGFPLALDVGPAVLHASSERKWVNAIRGADAWRTVRRLTLPQGPRALIAHLGEAGFDALREVRWVTPDQLEALEPRGRVLHTLGVVADTAELADVVRITSSWGLRRLELRASGDPAPIPPALARCVTPEVHIHRDSRTVAAVGGPGPSLRDRDSSVLSLDELVRTAPAERTLVSLTVDGGGLWRAREAGTFGAARLLDPSRTLDAELVLSAGPLAPEAPAGLRARADGTFRLSSLRRVGVPLPSVRVIGTPGGIAAAFPGEPVSIGRLEVTTVEGPVVPAASASTHRIDRLVAPDGIELVRDTAGVFSEAQLTWSRWYRAGEAPHTTLVALAPGLRKVGWHESHVQRPEASFAKLDRWLATMQLERAEGRPP
ncbi:MAG: TIGR02996 domain-containing protein [Myxococcota bacterium]